MIQLNESDLKLYSTIARNHLNDSIETKERLIRRKIGAIVNASKIISNAFQSGGKLLLCGNGGSAADCQHIAAEFVNLLNLENARPALPAIALSTDTSILTAVANDFGYDKIFSRQIQALGRPGDVLLGITTSGNSSNILLACAVAKDQQMTTIVMTGSGDLCYDVDYVINVPSAVTQHIQEAHITIGHILCKLVETQMFSSEE